MEIRYLSECVSQLVLEDRDTFDLAVRSHADPASVCVLWNVLGSASLAYDIASGRLHEPVRQVVSCFFGHEAVLESILNVLDECAETGCTARLAAVVRPLCAMLNALYHSTHVFRVEIGDEEPFEIDQDVLRCAEETEMVHEMYQKTEQKLDRAIRWANDRLRSCVAKCAVRVSFWKWRTALKHVRRARKTRMQQKRIDSLELELSNARSKAMCTGDLSQSIDDMRLETQKHEELKRALWFVTKPTEGHVKRLGDIHTLECVLSSPLADYNPYSVDELFKSLYACTGSHIVDCSFLFLKAYISGLQSVGAGNFRLVEAVAATDVPAIALLSALPSAESVTKSLLKFDAEKHKSIESAVIRALALDVDRVFDESSVGAAVAYANGELRVGSRKRNAAWASKPPPIDDEISSVSWSLSAGHRVTLADGTSFENPRDADSYSSTRLFVRRVTDEELSVKSRKIIRVNGKQVYAFRIPEQVPNGPVTPTGPGYVCTVTVFRIRPGDEYYAECDFTGKVNICDGCVEGCKLDWVSDVPPDGAYTATPYRRQMITSKHGRICIEPAELDVSCMNTDEVVPWPLFVYFGVFRLHHTMNLPLPEPCFGLWKRIIRLPLGRLHAGQAAATIDFIAETLATEREMDRVMPTIEAWAVSGALTRNVHMWRIRKCMHVGRLITRT